MVKRNASRVLLALLLVVPLVRFGSRPATAEPFVSPYALYLPIFVQSYQPRHGLAGGWLRCGDLDTLKPEWFHTWGWGVPCSDTAGVEYVDMLAWADRLEHEINTEWVMGWNEPNLCGGDNIAPAQAAVMWRQVEAQYADRKLVSPAPSQPVQDGRCQTWPGGFDWLWEMVRVYESLYRERPRFDALAAHYYDFGPETLQQYLTRVRAEALARGYDVALWLTEFGSCNVAWMDESVSWLELQPWVARWAWYSARLPDWRYGCSALLDELGLTEYGRRFVALSNERQGEVNGSTLETVYGLLAFDDTAILLHRWNLLWLVQGFGGEQ